MAKRILAANWKMNKTNAEAEAFCKLFLELNKNPNIEYIVAVPSTLIGTVSAGLKEIKVLVAAQNVGFASSGAYTGEVSVAQVKDAGASACIVGHSERRHIFSETDEWINKKMKLLGEQNMRVILCVGETFAERESGSMKSVLTAQLEGAFQGDASAYANIITVAYEPVWAIGTGVTASPADASDAATFIKAELQRILGVKAKAIPVLYGGSVTPESAKELFANKVIDGALVGGASLDAVKFIEIGKKL